MPAATLQPESIQLLAALSFLLLKHFIADYCVQTPYQFRNKGKYGHPGGLLHSAIHAMLTIPVIFILQPAAPYIGALIVASEFALHYHIDWSKEQVTRVTGWTPQTAYYWQLFGLDQFLHGMTYIAVVTVLLLYPARPLI